MQTLRELLAWALSRKRLAWAFLAAVVFLILFVGAHSTPYEQCEANYSTSNSPKQTANLKNSVVSGDELPMMIECEETFLNQNSGTFLFFVTCLLAAIAYQQYRTTRAQLRAYVSVRGNEKMQPEIGPTGVSIWLIAKNSGQTPARDVSAWVATDFLADPHSGPFHPLPEGSKRVRGTIGPTLDIGLRGLHGPLTEEQVTGVQEGALTLCLWGELTYSDVFGESHHTRFRFYVPVSEDGKVFGIQFSREGNEAN